MNVQESEEFKTSKFYCKTNFDMTEIKNFVQVGEDVKAMIKEIQQYKVK